MKKATPFQKKQAERKAKIIETYESALALNPEITKQEVTIILYKKGVCGTTLANQVIVEHLNSKLTA